MSTYYDIDGRECDLPTMCRREPEWAANRLAFSIAEIAKLTAALREVRDLASKVVADDTMNARYFMRSIVDVCNAAGIGEEAAK